MALLIAAAVAVTMVIILARRQRADVPPVDLSTLELRDVDEVADLGVEEEFTCQSAIALLNGSPQLTMDGMVRLMKRRWPEIRLSVESPDSPMQGRLAIGDSSVRFEPVSVRPDSRILECTGAPSAELPLHTGAILVTAHAESGALSALRLTQGVWALLKTCPQVTHVHWETSEQTFSRGELVKKFGGDMARVWPVDVWVSVHSREGEAGRSIGYTVGLGRMGGWDFEALESPETVADLERRLRNLAAYVVQDFAVLYNGESVGIDGFERIRLRRKVSETVHKGWVFQMTYERPSENSPWR